MWGLLLTVTLLVIRAQAGPLLFRPHDDKSSEEIIKSGEPLHKTLCPGKRVSCPSEYTCCKLASGEWGCCPLKNAVCCPDGVHCCPHGFKCKEKAGKCHNGYEVFSALQKISAHSVEEPESDSKEIIKMQKPKYLIEGRVICPDNESECRDGYTCCKMNGDHNYGCCLFPMAVCCIDGVHCCPHGYTCHVSTATCTIGSTGIMLPWVKKVKALVKNIECPDGSECPAGSTCCQLDNGRYACCPLPKAVSCSDRIHCCPSGYTCDLSAGTCSKEDEKIALIKKTPALLKLVICPDKKSECPDGSTCCKLSNGKYGCCPLPKAVCCSDGTHCCPNGYTCDVSAGTCSKGAEKIAWFEKAMATVKNVVCPDGQSECPNGNTCCKLPSGQYGCCPQPKAVCCSDGKHCCPNGYTCDISAGTCSKGAEKIAWFEKAMATVKNFICPDGQSECPTGNTCCKLPSGQYGCCPMPKAVCCSDGKHCCPHGSTCDVSVGTCSKEAEKIAWFEKAMATVKNIVCPDGQSECPNGNTCCKLPSGQYGCCPQPKAVCCSDGIHCCPFGYLCSTGTCRKGSENIAWLQKTTAMMKVKNVVCPDQKSECPDGSTCCKLSSGQYGCCPQPEAVCCSDHIHCCPFGYICNAGTGTCFRESESIAWLQKTSAVMKVQNVVCPDGQSECPTGNTCCKLSSGQYGCCPLPKAVCCSDHIHCCPFGYLCSTGTCRKGSENIAWLQKTSAMMKVKNVVCPDQKSECPDGSTCCKLSSGQYGCCPQPEAVCCSDHIHCCPFGYICNAGTGTCFRESESIAWLQKTSAVTKVQNVVCPDGQSECPTGNTCCKLSSGQYGCCPQPEAVCCSDHIHCCPFGYICNAGTGTCFRESESIAWLQKTSAVMNVQSVVCPDGQSECPTGNTCCKLPSGQYGCCPLPKAVCCSDGIHCCPFGYLCSNGTCRKGSENIAWLQKTSAMMKVKNVVCPDQKSECPDGSTCCKLSSGMYGCCPLPNAVCCSDNVHCCPNGYTCEPSSGACTKGAALISWVKKTAAKVAPAPRITCPDERWSCEDGTTCCKMSDGGYGCCPVINAVCCDDHIHCCPHQTTCDTKLERCVAGDGSSQPWLENTKAESHMSKASEADVNVMCNGTSYCQSGQTCCKTAGGSWACCPLPKAVCCDDHVHCCPNGYSCQTSTGKCNRGNLEIPLVKKVQASLRKDQDCGGNVTCSQENTCCMMKTGDMGCCPVPNAVCCLDGLHCCPSGMMCGNGDKKCVKREKALFESFRLKNKLDRNVL